MGRVTVICVFCWDLTALLAFGSSSRRARFFPYLILAWGVWEWGLPVGIYYYSHWGHLVQTPQISSGFKDKNSRALVFSRVFCFSLNVRQSLAWCPSLLPAAMTIVAILASSRSFSPPGSLLPISYPCLGRLGVRAPSGNLLLPSAQRAKREWKHNDIYGVWLLLGA